MNWVGLVLALVKLAGAITSWLHDAKMFKAGQAEEIAKALQEQADGLKVAIKARQDTRAELNRHPEQLREDDGFKRRH